MTFDPLASLLFGLAFSHHPGQQHVGDEIDLCFAAEPPGVDPDKTVEGPKEPGVVLDMHAKRRAVGIGFFDGGKPVFGRPRFPKGLVALGILVGNMVGFGVFENKSVETKLENPPDERIPILLDPRRKGEHFRRAACIDGRVVAESAAIEGVLADVSVDLDAALVCVADDFREETRA